MASSRRNESSCDFITDSWQTMTSLDAFAGGPLTFESILWGIFTCLITVSAFLWSKDPVTHNRRRLIMIVLCTIMYAMATAHWGVVFSWWRKMSALEVENLSKLLNSQPQNDATSGICSHMVLADFTAPYYLNSIVAPSCAPTIFVTINISLSDGIVLFRACTIWGRHRAMRTTSIMLFIGLLGTSGLNIYTACLSNAARECILCGFVGIPVVSLSCALNLWATCMIGYKAWSHKRIIKNYLASGNRRTRSEKILALFVDSGVLYTALWVVIVISDIATSPVLATYLQSTGLIQLVGMYPMILVAAVSWQNLLGSTGEIHTVDVLTRNVQPSVQLPMHVRIEAGALTTGPADSSDSIPSVIELATMRHGAALKDSVESCDVTAH